MQSSFWKLTALAGVVGIGIFVVLQAQQGLSDKANAAASAPGDQQPGAGIASVSQPGPQTQLPSGSLVPPGNLAEPPQPGTTSVSQPPTARPDDPRYRASRLPTPADGDAGPYRRTAQAPDARGPAGVITAGSDNRQPFPTPIRTTAAGEPAAGPDPFSDIVNNPSAPGPGAFPSTPAAAPTPTPFPELPPRPVAETPAAPSNGSAGGVSVGSPFDFPSPTPTAAEETPLLPEVDTNLQPPPASVNVANPGGNSTNNGFDPYEPATPATGNSLTAPPTSSRNDQPAALGPRDVPGGAVGDPFGPGFTADAPAASAPAPVESAPTGPTLASPPAFPTPADPTAAAATDAPPAVSPFENVPVAPSPEPPPESNGPRLSGPALSVPRSASVENSETPVPGETAVEVPGRARVTIGNNPTPTVPAPAFPTPVESPATENFSTTSQDATRNEPSDAGSDPLDNLLFPPARTASPLDGGTTPPTNTDSPFFPSPPATPTDVRVPEPVAAPEPAVTPAPALPGPVDFPFGTAPPVDSPAATPPGNPVPQPAFPAANTRPEAEPPRSLTNDDLRGDGVVGDQTMNQTLQPELRIEKVAPPRAILGQPLVYDIIVKNTGQSSAHQVTVEDQIPRGTRLTGTIPRAELIGTTLRWKLGTLEPRKETKISIRVIPTEEGPVGSVAKVNFVSEVASRTVITSPKLKVTLTGPSEATLGSQATYHFTISNVGRGDANGVYLRNLLPAGLTHADGNDLEYEVGVLPAGESREVDLSVIAAKNGPQINKAIVTANGGLKAETTMTTNIVGNRLAITRTGPRRRYIGREAEYTNTVVNESTSVVQNAQVVEQLPEGMLYLGGSPGIQYNPQKHSVTWPLTALQPRASTVLSVKLMPQTAGAKRSEVVAFDPNGTKAVVRSETVVEGFEALRLSVGEVPEPLEVGDEVRLRFVTNNRGTLPAENVRVAVQIPREMKFVSANGTSRGQQVGNTVVFEPIKSVAEKAEFDIAFKAVEAGDARFEFQIQSAEMADTLKRQEAVRILPKRQ